MLSAIPNKLITFNLRLMFHVQFSLSVHEVSHDRKGARSTFIKVHLYGGKTARMWRIGLGTMS